MYTIMIVDDESINRVLMRKVLERNLRNLKIIEAENGHMVFQLLQKHSIDLVILDLMMPEFDGYSVIKEMKARDEYKDIPVIINSAVDDMQSIAYTLQMGALDYFTKPITYELFNIVIPLKIKNALKYHEQQTELKKYNMQVERDLSIAKLTQQSLMYHKEKILNFHIESRYVPSAVLSGDIYDFVESEGVFWFIIADVMGHGVASAMISSIIKAMFRYTIAINKSPSMVLKDMNHFFNKILDSQNEICFSAFIGKIKDDTLIYSNGGHPYPLLIKNTPEDGNKLVFLKLNGFLLGISEEASYTDGYVEFHEGDRLLAYTDGLYENLDKNNFDFKWVQEYINNHDWILDTNPSVFLDSLIKHFKIDDENIHDDVAVFIITNKPYYSRD